MKPLTKSWDDIKAEWAKEDAYNALHPVYAFFKRHYNAVRRFIRNMPELPRDGYRKVKRGVQRAYRGWSNEDVWELFAYQARVTYAMLVSLKKNKHGYPATKDENGKFNYDEKRWDAILDKMIVAWKLNKDIADGERESFSPDFTEEQRKEYKGLTQGDEMTRRLGMALYAEYFACLWD